jgi:hypothetical protein
VAISGNASGNISQISAANALGTNPQMCCRVIHFGPLASPF